MSGAIHIISAGAGSGKTWALTDKLQALLSSGEVTPAGVIATTFTRLAAGELQERVRQKLIESGQLRIANQMEQALIGTVNGVCGELLHRFAFAAGLPPEQTVVDESQGNSLFYHAMEQALANDSKLLRQMNACCQRLQIVDPQSKQLRWRREVKNIVDSARANNQSAEDISQLGHASADALLAHFPAVGKGDLDRKLLTAMDKALGAIDTEDDSTKKTAGYLNQLRDLQKSLQKQDMNWSEWIKLSKDSLCPAKKSAECAEPVRAIAGDYARHPRLHRDIRFFTEQLFELAALSLEAYQQLKRRKGLIDFVDQEQQLYQLLGQPEIADTLRDELQLLMVDEFQDTSPIQLALFLKLAELADRVIWVGDIKQSIYGFRGADPDLMSAVVTRVTAAGNEPEILAQSWRSRPELVAYVNALFVPAFANTLASEQVQLTPAREMILTGPAVACWRLSGRNKARRADALASGIRELMTSGRTVIDKHSSTERALAYGDIAVLCRTHDNLNAIADALAAAGLPIRYQRPGLLATPEGCLALACLRRLIDPGDTLASAEIRSLTRCESPEQWMADRLTYLQDENNRSRHWLLDDADGPVARLDAQRQRLPFLTPLESLRVALDVASVRKSAYRWGPSTQRARHRLNNLSRLLEHAANYLEQCDGQNEPATGAGLILWLQALAADEQDSQASGGDEDAIQLVTHHGAKGLEWPLVIAMDMDAALKPRLWGLTVQPSPDPVQLEQPLKGRTLRYWPAFFGAQRSKIPLLEKIADSPAGIAALTLEHEEAKRLLYVSLTRPRDGLIITMNRQADSGEWMDTLDAKWMLPTADKLSLNSGHTIPSEYRELEAGADGATPPAFAPNWLTGNTTRNEKLPLRINPSAAAPLATAKIGRVIAFGERLSIKGDYAADQLGSALHAVIANVINGHREPDNAQRILEAHQMAQAISAESALLSATRLLAVLEQHFSPRSYATEYPIHYRNPAGQIMRGWIDLLVETASGYLIVDHKAGFRVGAGADREGDVLRYSGQLAAYAEAVSAATGRDVEGLWVHLAVDGKLVGVV